MKLDLWNKSLPRVELDQRARDARFRLEQFERLLVARTTVSASWLGRFLCLFSFGRPGEGSRTSRTRGPLIYRQPRMPQIHQAWVPSAP
jgi:hypothetical protein